MMQTDINDRTKELDKTVDPASASEEELGRIEAVGDEQRDVRALLEQMQLV